MVRDSERLNLINKIRGEGGGKRTIGPPESARTRTNQRKQSKQEREKAARQAKKVNQVRKNSECHYSRGKREQSNKAKDSMRNQR